MGVYRRATLSRLAGPGRLPGGGSIWAKSSKAQAGNSRLRHRNLDIPPRNDGNRERVMGDSDPSLTNCLSDGAFLMDHSETEES